MTQAEPRVHLPTLCSLALYIMASATGAPLGLAHRFAALPRPTLSSSELALTPSDLPTGDVHLPAETSHDIAMRETREVEYGMGTV